MTVVPEEVPAYGGCLWPMDPACRTVQWETYSEAVQNRALALASSSLQRLTGYRVGGCPVTVRPVPARNRCFIPWRGYYDPEQPYIPGLNASGDWVNTTEDAPGCTVALPKPVGRIEEVMVDGELVDFMDYQVDSGNLLVYVGDGDCPWPETQDLNLPDTEVGTFSVRYWNSYPVDSIGAYAVGLLALEFAKACAGDRCSLPSGVTTVTRQGLTYEIQGGMFPDGFTGIKAVDAYIALWNPKALTVESRVYVPSDRRTRINTSGFPVGYIYDGGGP